MHYSLMGNNKAAFKNSDLLSFKNSDVLSFKAGLAVINSLEHFLFQID